MTNEDWAEVEKRLKAVGWRVHLVCDGYLVTLVRGRVSEMRDAILPLLNGEPEFEWVGKDCGERERFARRREYYVYTKKSRENWRRLTPALQKSVAKEKGPNFDIHEVRVAYSPFWSSFKKLKAHLVKNNKEIRLIREGAQANASSGEKN